MPSRTLTRPTLLSINNYYYRRGGAETIFLAQNGLLESEGWTVVPFAMQHEKNLASEWSGYFADEIEFGREYPLARKVVMAGRVTYSVQARERLKQLLAIARPTVAHAHNVYHHLSPSIFGALAEAGIPTFLTLHDLKLACPAYKMLSREGVCERCKGGAIWQVSLNRCIKDSFALSMLVMVESALHRLLGSYSKHVTRFVVPSRFYLEKFVEWGWPRERFVHIPNFVDAETVVATTTPGRPGKEFVYIGRLSPEKGLATLVRAAALSGTRVVVVGAGPEEGRLRSVIEDTGANVELLGARVGEALFRIVRDARALILPSEWYENAPVSVLEAYVLGRPVIGARIGGIPELCRDDETGWLFKAGDPESLAEVMRRVASLPDNVLTAMGAAGREWALRDFSPARYRERLLDLYRDAGVAC